MSRLAVSLMLLLSLQGVWAQLAQGANPAEVADEAVRHWQARAQAFDYVALASVSPVAMCQELALFGQDPRVIAATNVNLSDRRLLEAQSNDDERIYSYAASFGQNALGRVQVRVLRSAQPQGNQNNQTSQGTLTLDNQDNETNAADADTAAEDDGASIWQADGVMLELDNPAAQLPSFMRSDAVGWLFILLSLYVLYALSRPSWLRRLLSQSLQVLREHKRIVIGSTILLYGSYIFGSLAGISLPECQEALAVFVSNSLRSTGVVDVLEENSVPKLAAVITYWNFVQGSLATTLIPAAFFAVPAYIINIARFFMLGFALAPVGETAGLLLFHLPVIIIELLAYVLITAGGGIFVATLFRQGFANFRLAMRKLLYTIPVAFVLLLIGAWYESVEILRLIPAFLAGL